MAEIDVVQLMAQHQGKLLFGQLCLEVHRIPHDKASGQPGGDPRPDLSGLHPELQPVGPQGHQLLLLQLAPLPPPAHQGEGPVTIPQEQPHRHRGPQEGQGQQRTAVQLHRRSFPAGRTTGYSPRPVVGGRAGKPARRISRPAGAAQQVPDRYRRTLTAGQPPQVPKYADAPRYIPDCHPLLGGEEPEEQRAQQEQDGQDDPSASPAFR